MHLPFDQSFRFHRRRLIFVLFRGRGCMLAVQLGEALGYRQGRYLADYITGRWSKEFTKGYDYDILKGDDLRQFRELMSEASADRSGKVPEAWEDASGKMSEACLGFLDPKTSQLMIVYESGINAACLKSNKPAGVQLRVKLARQILPAIVHAGAYQTSISRDDIARVAREEVSRALLPDPGRLLPLSAIEEDEVREVLRPVLFKMFSAIRAHESIRPDGTRAPCIATNAELAQDFRELGETCDEITVHRILGALIENEAIFPEPGPPRKLWTLLPAAPADVLLLPPAAAASALLPPRPERSIVASPPPPPIVASPPPPPTTSAPRVAPYPAEPRPAAPPTPAPVRNCGEAVWTIPTPLPPQVARVVLSDPEPTSPRRPAASPPRETPAIPVQVRPAPPARTPPAPVPASPPPVDPLAAAITEQLQAAPPEGLTYKQIAKSLHRKKEEVHTALCGLVNQKFVSVTRALPCLYSLAAPPVPSVQQPAAAPRSSAVVEHAPPAAVASTPIPPLHTAQILERLNPLIPPESDDWPVYLSLIGRFHRVNCLALRVEAWDLLKRVSPPFAAPAPPPPLARVLAPIMRPRQPESHRPQDHRAFQIAEPPARRTRKRPSGA